LGFLAPLLQGLSLKHHELWDVVGSGAVETEAINGSKLAPLGADQLGEMGCVAPGAILDDHG